MSKHPPILFSTPMVQAILDGRKTMTRRVVKPQPEGDFCGVCTSSTKSKDIGSFAWSNGEKITNNICCPYGESGDILWVKETYYAWGRWRKDGTTKTGKQKWQFVDLTDDADLPYCYEDCAPEEVLTGHSEEIGYYKRPSLFMPKSACRIFLRVTDVRCERLGDITEDDAKKEGAELAYNPNLYVPGTLGFPVDTYRAGFAQLWRSIHGDWNPDTWVWVVSFGRIEKPENFR